MIRFAAIVFFLCHTTVAFSHNADNRIRFDFEQHEQPFHLHPRSTSEGYRLSLHDQESHSGWQCLAMKTPAGRPPAFNQTDKATWRTDAAPYRGKRIRWSAHVRLLSEPQPQNGPALWVSSIRPEFRPGAWSDMGGHSVRSNQWQQVEVVLDIETDARVICMSPVGRQ